MWLCGLFVVGCSIQTHNKLHPPTDLGSKYPRSLNRAKGNA